MAVVRLGRRFLVVRERKHGQGWYLPAGRVEAGESPWLVTWSTSGSATLLATLPSDSSGPTRVVHFEPREGCELRWRHPPDASGWSATLPAGDAAVVELLRKP